MDTLKEFLDSSSIAGLTQVANNKGLVRLFWTIVVILGFAVSGLLIQMSFMSWAESPVRTTIETVPIKELTFPKVTVCPPKNTYTNLNYDLMRAKNMTIGKETREELSNFAMTVLQDYLQENFMANLSKIQEKDRYYNWYHGISLIEIPRNGYQGLFVFKIYTWARSGKISTEHFGDVFDPVKVDRNIRYQVREGVNKKKKWENSH